MMTTVEEQLPEITASAEPQAPATERRELSDWQAQLLALTITIGLTTLFVLLFSWLTGSL
jgi:hypothetical protein